MSEECAERRFRTLFISDVHLGARGSQADRLLDFLRSHDADTIYLVGDIVDGWALKSNWYWPQSHNDFVQKMLRKARKGAKVIYVPGNHDEFLRNYYGTHFGGIDVMENTIHEGVDGKRYLVIHGDIFDLVVQNARWLAHLGDKAYDFAIQMNRLVNFFRRMFGVPYWSLSQWAKLKVKNAVNYIGAFEKTLAGEARRHGAGLAVSEMVSSFAIHYGNRRTLQELLVVDPEERRRGPVAIQLFGSDPEVMRSAAATLSGVSLIVSALLPATGAMRRAPSTTRSRSIVSLRSAFERNSVFTTCCSNSRRLLGVSGTTFSTFASTTRWKVCPAAASAASA